MTKWKRDENIFKAFLRNTPTTVKRKNCPVLRCVIFHFERPTVLSPSKKRCFKVCCIALAYSWPVGGVALAIFVASACIIYAFPCIFLHQLFFDARICRKQARTKPEQSQLHASYKPAMIIINAFKYRTSKVCVCHQPNWAMGMPNIPVSMCVSVLTLVNSIQLRVAFSILLSLKQTACWS